VASKKTISGVDDPGAADPGGKRRMLPAVSSQAANQRSIQGLAAAMLQAAGAGAAGRAGAATRDDAQARLSSGATRELHHSGRVMRRD
jgi:hypothetical protein